MAAVEPWQESTVRAWEDAAPHPALVWVGGIAGVLSLCLAVLLWPFHDSDRWVTALWGVCSVIALGALGGMWCARHRQRAVARAAIMPLARPEGGSLRLSTLLRRPELIVGVLTLIGGMGLGLIGRHMRSALLLGLVLAIVGAWVSGAALRRWYWTGRAESAGIPVTYGLQGGRVRLLAGSTVVAEYCTDRRGGNGRPTQGMMLGDPRLGGWVRVLLDGGAVVPTTPLRSPGRLSSAEEEQWPRSWRAWGDTVILAMLAPVLIGVGAVAQRGVDEFNRGHGTAGSLTVVREHCGGRSRSCTFVGDFVSSDGRLRVDDVPYTADATVGQTIPVVLVGSEAWTPTGPSRVFPAVMLITGVLAGAIVLGAWERRPRLPGQSRRR